MKNIAKTFLLTLLFIAASASRADVLNQGPGGFNLRITAEVPVEPATAYQQFIRVGEWWVASHSWFGKSENFSIDPQAGGCFCEKNGDQEVLHMLVTFVNPGSEVRMTGGLGPLQLMGLHGGMSWKFEPIDQGTRIVQIYNVSGYAPGGLESLAPVVDAVQTQQLNALVQRLTGERPRAE